jgi:hypothetical protein
MAPYFASDPGTPIGVSGMAKAVWNLAYRLWVTRAPWLWLVGPGDRRAFAVSYQPSLVLRPSGALPTPEALGVHRASTRIRCCGWSETAPYDRPVDAHHQQPPPTQGSR